VLSVAPSRRAPQSLRAASARARREGNGFAHAQVAQIQRARILAAMFDVATEHGAGNVSVADVVERSGVSRRTFYETFADREDCFLAAFDDALAFASQRVLPAYRTERRWRERIRAGVVAFLSFLDEEPVIGRLLVRESLTAGEKTRARRDEVLALLASVVDEGRGESKNAATLPSLTAEGLVGGALSIIDARISSDTSMLELANSLVSMIVLAYLGPLAARRELERPVEAPVGERHDARLLVDPFKGRGLRLTYRTVRVLMAVAEHSGASNRAVGESAGIEDQGQISKLLGRLQRLELIENTGIGPGQGAPNAWSLTASGHQMVRSIRTHTDEQSQGAGER
jgi:AcrR family transcriptional regulator